jgi:hypothetical protein
VMQPKSNPQIVLGVWYYYSCRYIEKTRNRRRVRVGSSFISVLTTGIGVFGRRCLSAICVLGEVWQSSYSLRKTVYWSVRVGCDEVHDRVELIGD